MAVPPGTRVEHAGPFDNSSTYHRHLPMPVMGACYFPPTTPNYLFQPPPSRARHFRTLALDWLHTW